MALIVGPITTHDSAAYHPPGITGDDWGYLVSDTSLLDLTTFLTLNILTVQTSPSNVRTPLLGSNVTYVAVLSAARDAAITAGATAMSGGATFANDFDAPASGHGTWEPA